MEQEEFFELAEEDLRREAEKRRFIYADVEEIISRNYLTQTLKLEGNTITLRSSLPHDYSALEHVGTLSGYEYIAWTIAHHVCAINGFIVSENKKDNHAFQVYHDFVAKQSFSIIEVFFYCLKGLRDRAERTLKLIEAFSYESYSRSYWNLVKDLQVGDNLNVTSKIWRTFNRNEDRRVEDNSAWERTKVIAGSMSKKAFDQIGKFLKELNSKEKQNKQKVIEAAVNWVFYGDPEEKEKQKPVQVVLGDKTYQLSQNKGSESVEDMIAEMKQVMRGEKDFHDIMVENYHENIRRKRQEIREKRRQALEEALERRSEEELTGGTIIAGYTKQQLEELNMAREKKTGAIRDEKEGYLFERYFKPKVVPGVLGKTGPERATQENTQKKTKKSLQERVASRKPNLNSNK